MEPLEVLITVLMAGSVTLAVWLCLPDVLYVLGLTRIQRGIASGPEEVPPHAAGEMAEDPLARLTELGFRPLGVYWERLPAHKTFHEHVFTSASGDCFATVFRLSHRDPLRTSFLTTFEGSSLVFTQNYTGGLEADEPTIRAGSPAAPPVAAPLAEEPAPIKRHVITLAIFGMSATAGFLLTERMDVNPHVAVAAIALAGIAATMAFLGRSVPRPNGDSRQYPERSPLDEVLAEHRRRIEQFQQAGQHPLRGASLDDFLQAEAVFGEHPHVRRQLRGSILAVLLFKGGFLLVGPALAAGLVGTDHPLVWAVLLLECLAVLLVRYWGLPKSASNPCSQSG